jgi:hypothetical protein
MHYSRLIFGQKSTFSAEPDQQITESYIRIIRNPMWTPLRICNL